MSSMSDFDIQNGVLKKYNGSDADVVIPVSVTSIGNSAFEGCRSLERITIPDSVIKIGKSAFEYCNGLTSITIPQSVREIGEYAFANCCSLASATIQEGVTYIGESAFMNCDSLTSATIPASVKEIGSSAFKNCGGLTSVMIPASVTNIGQCAFWHCKGLADGDGYVIVKNTVYDYYGAKKKLTIPKGVTEIGACSFAEPKGVTEIRAHHSKLTSVTIPDGVTAIGNSAFSGCTELCRVDLPESLEEFSISAFQDCINIKKVYLPDGVKTLYGNCLPYVTIVTLFSIPFACKILHLYNFSVSGIEVRVKYPEGGAILFDSDIKSVAAISGHPEPSSDDMYISMVENKILKKKNIADIALMLLTSDKYTLSKEAKKFYSSVVSYCRSDLFEKAVNRMSFEEAEILNDIAKISLDILNKKFDEARNVNDTVKTAWLLELKNRLFNKKEVDKHQEKEIERAFTPTVDDIKKLWPCKKLDDGTLEVYGYTGTEEGICIPDKIGKAAVSRVGFNPNSKASFRSLKAVDLPQSVKTIGENAFSYCISLTSATIPDGVTQIGRYAFRECKNLTSATIPDGVTKIEYGTFSGCGSLTTVTIPESVTKIRQYAFLGCSNLTIHANAGSFAETYAKENNIRFVAE